MGHAILKNIKHHFDLQISSAYIFSQILFLLLSGLAKLVWTILKRDSWKCLFIKLKPLFKFIWFFNHYTKLFLRLVEISKRGLKYLKVKLQYKKHDGCKSIYQCHTFLLFSHLFVERCFSAEGHWENCPEDKRHWWVTKSGFSRNRLLPRDVLPPHVFSWSNV